MICPDCELDTLHIAHSLELPPDADNDEIALQVAGCTNCGLQALAVYRESRRGALDAESWQHEGYRVSAEDFRTIRSLIKRCPAPRDKRCPCSTHQRLGRTSGYRWDGLRQSGVTIQGVFSVRVEAR